MDEHIIEAHGKAKIIIKDGEVKQIKGPLSLEYCPLLDTYRGIDKITTDLIKLATESRIKMTGMCTEKRIVELKPSLVNFGTSEIIMCAMEEKMLDAAVICCEGVGTVITDRPKIVQGIGGFMSGLVKTSPIPKVIEKLQKKDCIIADSKNASIDQAKGLKLAFEHGFEKVGVTSAGVDEAQKCREIEKEAGGKAVIFGVHTSGMSKEDAEKFKELVDITTACASKYIREVAKEALMQVGTKVPVFAFTEEGKLFLLNRIKYMKTQVLVKTVDLPELAEGKQPRPLF